MEPLEHQEDLVTDQTDRTPTLESSARSSARRAVHHVTSTGPSCTHCRAPRVPVREGRGACCGTATSVTRLHRRRYCSSHAGRSLIIGGRNHAAPIVRTLRKLLSADSRLLHRAERSTADRADHLRHQEQDRRGAAHARPGQHPGRPLARSRACPPAGHGLCGDLDRAAAGLRPRTVDLYMLAVEASHRASSPARPWGNRRRWSCAAGGRAARLGRQQHDGSQSTGCCARFSTQRSRTTSSSATRARSAVAVTRTLRSGQH